MQAIIDPSMLSPRGIGRCYQSSLDDISRGGCVLSAAELLSSRVAIPQGDPLYLVGDYRLYIERCIRYVWVVGDM